MGGGRIGLLFSLLSQCVREARQEPGGVSRLTDLFLSTAES